MSGSPLQWVRKRDGRLAAFEPDKISRALFAAGERLGRPDPFLARELTDGVLHFLHAEKPGPLVTAEQIGELVIKVVRELGQPALARAFEEGQGARTRSAEHSTLAPALADEPEQAGVEADPAAGQPGPNWLDQPLAPAELAWRIAVPVLRQEGLAEIFSRDLQAAHADGLLVLGGLHAPLEMAGCVLPFGGNGPASILAALEQAREVAGTFVAIDGPEYLLARHRYSPEAAADFVHAFASGLRLAHLAAVLNLNCPTPPGGEPVLGPLFGERLFDAAKELLDALRQALLDAACDESAASSQLRIDWHLQGEDLALAGVPGLQRLARRVQEGAPLAFVLDRPRRPVGLAEGLDRDHPGLLMEVGVCLPRLVDQAGGHWDAAEFVHKVGSLARLALSTGTQKRDFLRRRARQRPLLAERFLLDRARLKVVPLGLEEAVRRVLSAPTGQDEAVSQLASQVVARLEHVLEEDGRGRLLSTCVDPAFPSADFPNPGGKPDNGGVGQEKALLLTSSDPPGVETVIRTLQQAWRRPEVSRVRWCSPDTSARQLTAPWATS